MMSSGKTGPAIRTVGVLGCGLMGSGIAQVCAQSGYRTIVREVDSAAVTAGLERIETFLAGAVKRNKISTEDRDAAMAALSGTTVLEDLAACDLVIEAIVEDLEAKRDVYVALDRLVGSDTIFASNTSSLCITEMASVTTRP